MSCKCAVLSLICTVGLPSAIAQGTPTIPTAAASDAFHEAQTLCQADGGRLWRHSLCGPMLFVDPQTRAVVANQPDADGVLRKDGAVYAGTLPQNLNASNTAIKWLGTEWSEILWPLPEGRSLRDTLMMHESFHRIQGQLGFGEFQSPDNAQLDTVEGRIDFQLEERALTRALQAGTDAERREAARDALLFRAERDAQFPQAKAEEQELEVNEGLAEYTGVRLGNASAAEQVEAALNDIAMVENAKTFVRSFAYATGPAYGLLLDRYAPGWRATVGPEWSPSSALAAALAFQTPPDLQKVVEARAALYDGAALRRAEMQRAEKQKVLLAGYRARFVQGPVLTVKLIHMHVQFNPQTLQPLGDAGTVYPTMRIADEWGVLEVSDGALLKPDWSAVVLEAPKDVSGATVSGKGWTLQLKPGWSVVPGARKGDLVLQAEAQGKGK